jgi:hypothetical protein
MAQLRRVDIRDKDLHGLKYFRLGGGQRSERFPQG